MLLFEAYPTKATADGVLAEWPDSPVELSMGLPARQMQCKRVLAHIGRGSPLF